MLASRLAFVALTASVLLVAHPSFAQDESLRLRGIVTDEQGAPVKDVDVTMTWRPEGRAAVATGANGAFEFDVPGLSARGRLLRAKANGGACRPLFNCRRKRRPRDSAR
jgi:hypothetical protein